MHIDSPSDRNKDMERQKHRKTDKDMERQKHRSMDRRKTERQKDRQTDKQIVGKEKKD